jgi:hypothetical protein
LSEAAFTWIPRRDAGSQPSEVDRAFQEMGSRSGSGSSSIEARQEELRQRILVAEARVRGETPAVPLTNDDFGQSISELRIQPRPAAQTLSPSNS